MDEPAVSLEHGCPFCHIAKTFPTYNPTVPPHASHPSISPASTEPQPAAFVILSTPIVVAFLDILPLSRGHVLLCPRKHRHKLTEVSAEESAQLGYWLRILSAAISKATGVHDWNVVQNNGAAAAQVVPHCHFHIIPRPELREQGRWSSQFTMFGRGQRAELDDDEAVEVAAKIRTAVAEVLKDESSQPNL